MKKKKFIVILIALTMMIIPKVNAAVTGYDYELLYSESNLQWQEQYANEIQLIEEYVNTHGISSYNYDNGNYLLGINLSQIANNDIRVCLSSIPEVKISTTYTSNQYGTSGRLGLSGSAQYCQRFAINNGVVSTLNEAQLSGGALLNSTVDLTTCDPTNENCNLYINNWYYNADDLTDEMRISWNTTACSGVNNCKNTGIMMSNIEDTILTYAYGEQIPTKDFFKNLKPAPEIEPEENTCPVVEVATITAPNNFTTGGTVTINKDTPITWQEIWFDSKIPVLNGGNIPNDYWEISSYKGGENRDLYNYFYNFQCNVIEDTENAGNYTFHCNLKYYFTTESEEDIQTTAVFVVNRNPNYNEDILNNTIITATKCQNNETNVQTTINNNVDDTNFDNWWNNVTTTLSNILNFLKPSNLIYLIVPTENQMQSLLNETQESINSKLGILGLPLTIYTRLMNLANTSTEENWCLTWQGVKVPNFENSEIIPQGEWCFNQITQNQTINNFRTIALNIIGGLILLAFIQYLNNVYHKVIESPDRDDYEYISTEDIYNVNDKTGELKNHRYVTKTTIRQRRDK